MTSMKCDLCGSWSPDATATAARIRRDIDSTVAAIGTRDHRSDSIDGIADDLTNLNASEISSEFDAAELEWSCDTCTLSNPSSRRRCAACNEPKLVPINSTTSRQSSSDGIIATVGDQVIMMNATHLDELNRLNQRIDTETAHLFSNTGRHTGNCDDTNGRMTTESNRTSSPLSSLSSLSPAINSGNCDEVKQLPTKSDDMKRPSSSTSWSIPTQPCGAILATTRADSMSALPLPAHLHPAAAITATSSPAPTATATATAIDEPEKHAVDIATSIAREDIELHQQ